MSLTPGGVIRGRVRQFFPGLDEDRIGAVVAALLAEEWALAEELLGMTPSDHPRLRLGSLLPHFDIATSIDWTTAKYVTLGGRS